MRETLVAAAQARGGVLTRAEALSVASGRVLDGAVAAGALTRLFPQVYVLTALTDRPDVRRRAAQVYRPDAALSHLDALAVWALPGPEPDADAERPVHLTCSAARTNVEVPGIRLCRRRGFRLGSPHTVQRRGLHVVRLEQAVVESWPLLPLWSRRAPAIVAVRERRTTGARLLSTLARQPRTAGAAQLRRLFELLHLGVHSELEAWGHERVFDRPGLRHARCQFKVAVHSGVVYVDRYYVDEQLAIELDGAAYHGSPGQRERDIRRDARLAAIGIQTLRFSHHRLFADPDGVAAEILLVLATRRRQLHRSA